MSINTNFTQNWQNNIRNGLPDSKTPQSDVIYDSNTFGSSIIASSDPRLQPHSACLIWPLQMDSGLAPSKYWYVMVISNTGPKLVLVKVFEQSECFVLD